ncbi:hypothetical protein [Actinomadura bangladeshensis]|uniref:Uncharacterized protein n=1 Tax=Actinomadura bangladeshensis TaxID=453573 RepID=A0A4V2XLV2_9ACTN|nr:hypothetical protein [Actinomadura bangladeshensis]TDC11736.1 hypothetical protein E1284_26990 [Actinomadura bangladeshensis]
MAVTAHVLLFPLGLPSDAPVILAYSAACGLLLAPFYFMGSRAGCMFVPLSQQIYRHQEQYGRPPDEQDPMIAQTKRLGIWMLLPRVLRLVLLGGTAYVGYRVGWELDFESQHFLLVVIWAAGVFASRGGFNRKSHIPRRNALMLAATVSAIAILMPAPLALFMTTTLIIDGLVGCVSLGIFQNPSMYSQQTMESIGVMRYLRSVPQDRLQE